MLLTVQAIPFILLSRLAFYLPIKSLKVDLDACLVTVAACGNIIPKPYVDYLAIGEDHRFQAHPGVDCISIGRAILVAITKRKVQGASTIEQQLVRTVSGRYERSFRRKFREQLLAVALSRCCSKNQIASAYLAIAYYGHNLTGLDAIRKLADGNLNTRSPEQMASIIARLKYPEPATATPLWESRLAERVAYIQRNYR